MSEVTATITTPVDGALIVCLACKAELRTDWPGTLDAFRAWHREHCGGSNTRPNPQVKGGMIRPEGGPATRERPGPWPPPDSEVRA